MVKCTEPDIFIPVVEDLLESYKMFIRNESLSLQALPVGRLFFEKVDELNSWITLYKSFKKAIRDCRKNGYAVITKEQYSRLGIYDIGNVEEFS